MAGWAVGQTDRFAAAVAMSVVSNYVSFHLTSEVWWYDHAILEGDWNDPASQYADRSPVTHAHRCTTPTLILQGAEDRCTPVSQAEELFTALAETRHRGRARGLSARGSRAGGAGARAGRDRTDAGLVRRAPLGDRSCARRRSQPMGGSTAAASIRPSVVLLFTRMYMLRTNAHTGITRFIQGEIVTRKRRIAAAA